MRFFIVHRLSFIVWLLGFGIWDLGFSQPDSLWTRSFDLGANDFAQGIASTTDGGFLVAGYTTDPARLDSGRGWVMKCNANGDSLWRRPYNSFARVNALLLTANNGFAICGRTQNFVAILSVCDANGTIQWTGTRSTQAEFHSLCRTSDNGYAACGYRWINNGSRQDALVVKFSSTGNFLWQWTSNLTGWDEAAEIARTTDGELVIHCTTVREPNAALLTRLSNNGTFRWTREFTCPENTYIRGTHVLADSAAGCFVLNILEPADGSIGYGMTRLSSQQQAVWTLTDQPPEVRKELRTLSKLQGGDFVLCGLFEEETRSVFVERRTNNNVPDWSLRFRDPDLQPYAVAANDSGFLIAGTDFSDHSDANIFILKAGVAPLAAVSNLTLRRQTGFSSNLRLTWSAVAGAVSYNIYRYTSTEFTPAPGNLLASTAATQFDDVGAVNLGPVQHFYVVTAVNAGGTVVASPDLDVVWVAETQEKTAPKVK